MPILEIGSRLAEVLELRPVEVGVELDVGRPKPPAVGQAKDEVAATLTRPPRSNPGALGEEAREARQAVVPIVVAGNREEMRHFVLGEVRESRAVGADEAVAVRLPARTWIDLIASEDERAAALGDKARLELEGLSREQPGDRVGRIEALTDVGRVVEPECAILVPVRGIGVRRSRRLPFSWFQVLAVARHVRPPARACREASRTRRRRRPRSPRRSGTSVRATGPSPGARSRSRPRSWGGAAGAESWSGGATTATLSHTDDARRLESRPGAGSGVQPQQRGALCRRHVRRGLARDLHQRHRSGAVQTRPLDRSQLRLECACGFRRRAFCTRGCVPRNRSPSR